MVNALSLVGVEYEVQGTLQVVLKGFWPVAATLKVSAQNMERFFWLVVVVLIPWKMRPRGNRRFEEVLHDARIRVGVKKGQGEALEGGERRKETTEKEVDGGKRRRTWAW